MILDRFVSRVDPNARAGSAGRVIVALFAAVISLGVPSTSAADPNGRVFLGQLDGWRLTRYDEYSFTQDGKDYLVTRIRH